MVLSSPSDHKADQSDKNKYQQGQRKSECQRFIEGGILCAARNQTLANFQPWYGAAIGLHNY